MAEKESITILNLTKELQKSVASFLSVSDAYALMCTCLSFQSTIRHSPRLWKQWCFQRWPLHLKDDKDGTTVVVDAGNKDDDLSPYRTPEPDYYNLLRHSAELSPPTGLDTTKRAPLLPYRQDIFAASKIVEAQPTTTLRLNADAESRARYFTVRSAEPLPRPKITGRPYVWPFRQKHTESNTDYSMVVTPGHASYFEITILPIPKESRPIMRARQSLPLTVGIGLSFDKDLPSHGSCACGNCGHFPGWDDGSVGYHGDNGELYHGIASGRYRIGPNFGGGDTVGCGVDYQEEGGTIFFTKNGALTGYVVDKDIKGRLLDRENNAVPLYPVVALSRDGPNPTVNVNFGRTEFVFDLCKYIHRERDS